MTLAPDVPQYMRRVVLDPIPELSAIRDAVGVQKIVTPLGLPAYLVTRYGDVKAALADPARFSNRKPPGWGAEPRSPLKSTHSSAPETCSGSTPQNTSGCAACSLPSSQSGG